MPLIPQRSVQAQSPPIGPLLNALVQARNADARRQFLASQSLGQGLQAGGQAVGRSMFETAEGDKDRRSRMAASILGILTRPDAGPEQISRGLALAAHFDPALAASLQKSGALGFSNNQADAAADMLAEDRKNLAKATPDFGKGGGAESAPIAGPKAVAPFMQTPAATRDKAESLTMAEKSLRNPVVRAMRVQKGPDGVDRAVPQHAPRTIDESFAQAIYGKALASKDDPDKIIDQAYAALKASPDLKAELDVLFAKKAKGHRLDVVTTPLIVVPNGPNKGKVKDMRTGKIVLPGFNQLGPGIFGTGEVRDPDVMSLSDPWTATKERAAGQRNRRSREALQKRLAAYAKEFGGELELEQIEGDSGPFGTTTKPGYRILAKLKKPLDPLEFVFPRADARRIIDAARRQQINRAKALEAFTGSFGIGGP